MRETACDAALFRLRAFESDWVAPLLEPEAGPLAPLLVAESARWIEVGRLVGYFADVPAATPMDDAAAAFRARMTADAEGVDDAAAFGARLVEAQEDLTPARCAFLELVLFADEATWRRRFDESAGFIASLQESETPNPDPVALERSAWILEGASSGISAVPRTPAHWRSQAPGALAAAWPQAEERMLLVAELYAQAMETAATLAAREHWRVLAEREPPWERLAEAAGAPAETRGAFKIESLERGLGTPVGRSLRHALLSSLEGAAVTTVQIAGITRETSTISGVREDAAEIAGNVAGLVCRIDSDASRVEAQLAATGPGEATGRDIALPAGVEILNPDAHIATLEPGARLEAQLTIERGRGRRPAEAQVFDEAVDAIALDASFSPVLRVAVRVEPASEDDAAARDLLTLEIETDGSLAPHEALQEATEIVAEHLSGFEAVEEAP